MAGMMFLKMQAAGNDFVLVDARDGPAGEWESLARAVCARNVGVGADGLLVIQRSAVADARMRMFNPDGTEDMCGNGLRCIIRHLRDGKPGELTMETVAGIVPGSLEPDGTVTVVLPPPSFRARDLPARANRDRLWDFPLEIEGREFRLFGVSTGTPHVIRFSPGEVAEEDFRRFSPLIEHHPLFPERTSVCWVTPDGRDRLRARVWERAAGETLACGTGACAAVAVAYAIGLTDSCAAVTMRGGVLHVEVREDGAMRLNGPAKVVFRGVWTESGD